MMFIYQFHPTNESWSITTCHKDMSSDENTVNNVLVTIRLCYTKSDLITCVSLSLFSVSETLRKITCCTYKSICGKREVIWKERRIVFLCIQTNQAWACLNTYIYLFWSSNLRNCFMEMAVTDVLYYSISLHSMQACGWKDGV